MLFPDIWKLAANDEPIVSRARPGAVTITQARLSGATAPGQD